MKLLSLLLQTGPPRWCPWAREGLEKARVFASDEPQQGGDTPRLRQILRATNCYKLSDLMGEGQTMSAQNLTKCHNIPYSPSSSTTRLTY